MEPQQQQYSPTEVEVFKLTTTVRMRETLGTFTKMLTHTLQLVMGMLSHPDRQTRSAIDPDHKFCYANFTVLIDESATDEQIAVGREQLSQMYDEFVAAERAKCLRVTLVH